MGAITFRRHSAQWYARRTARALVVYGLLIGLGAIFILPFLWSLTSSLRETGAPLGFPPQFLPTQFNWRNYVRVFEMIPFATFFRNSVIVTTIAVFGELLSASLVAFGFARLRFPGRNLLFILLLSTMMIPYPVTMIPSFILWVRGLGMANTFGPLVLPPFFGPAFSIFLLRQFFMTINTELDEAAKIDGASEFRIYWQIILPLAKPALATIAIFSFMANWNDFLTPLIYLSDRNLYTLALGINFLRNMRGGGELALQMAGAVMFIAPCIILYFLAQRFVIQGIVTTGLKG
ncbi:MAG: carbohydrate ABC transporter permease [Thermoflexales bacterium]|nr:carbohydrate ABC transporter permease [Thermoflexales bacterium]MDW8350634.1 carbohydrate ABC transporter permease [Anaerolineae bacterium]